MMSITGRGALACNLAHHGSQVYWKDTGIGP